MTKPIVDPDLDGTDPDHIAHGTYGGYQQHHRLAVPTCDPCRDAAADYQRRYRTDTENRAVLRDRYARRYVLTELRHLAPDLYTRLYREAARRWEDNHPIGATQ